MKVSVRQGDSLTYYSGLFMVPYPLIVDSNKDLDSSNISVGQTVLIPGFSTEKQVLSETDHLWKLAASRNLTIDALLLLNQDINMNQLGAGSIVTVPKRIIKPVVNGKRKYDFNALEEDITSLQQLYPFIDANIIGESVLGKPIKELRIGNGEKKVHMNGSFHANEWITSATLMALLNSYLLSIVNFQPMRDIQTAPFYDLVDLSIVPMVNPDGVNLVLNGPEENFRDKVLEINEDCSEFTGWKANIRGIDLNNQYPAKWEVEKERKIPKKPASRDYPGDEALTEPEAIAMAKLAENNEFDRVIAFHTQGEEFYWGYEQLEPPESEMMAKEFERVSGYRAVQYVDSHAGYKDWFIQHFRKPGFTIELGKGINPLPLSQFDSIYKRAEGIFLASLYM